MIPRRILTAAAVAGALLIPTAGAASAAVPTPDRGQPVRQVCREHYVVHHGYHYDCRLVPARSSAKGSTWLLRAGSTAAPATTTWH